MQILLTLFYTLIFVLSIYKLKFFAIPGFSRNAVAAVFILKIFAGIAVWWVYTYYYPGGDMQNYFDDGKKLFHLLLDKPKLFYNVVFNNAHYSGLKIWNANFDSALYNDAHTMSLLNMLFLFFSFGCLQVHIVFMCFLSMTGLTALYKTFEKYVPLQRNKLFIAVFLVPSVLFWSSGILKEGLLIFGLGIFLYSSNCGLPTSYNRRKITALLLSLFILLVIKFYVLIALLPGLCLNLIVRYTSEKLLFIKYFSVVIIIGIGAFALTYINKDYNPLVLIKDKQAKAILEARGGVYLSNKEKVVCINYIDKEEQLKQINDSTYKIVKGSNYIFWKADDMSTYDSIIKSQDTSSYQIAYTVVPAQSIIKLNFIKPDFSNILAVLPQALFNVFLQPMIWDADDIIQLIPAVENIIIVILIILSLVFINKKFENKTIVFFCLSFVLILFVLVGITTPAVGALIRYKIPALPFLLISLILITSKSKAN